MANVKAVLAILAVTSTVAYCRDRLRHRESRTDREATALSDTSLPSAVAAAAPPTSGGGCSSCPHPHREYLKALRIESIKHQLLKKLHLSEPPVVRARPIPEPLTSLVHSTGTNEFIRDDDQRHNVHRAQTDDELERIINYNFATKLPPDRDQGVSEVCYFHFDRNLAPKQILSATLFVYVKPVTTSRQHSTMFLLYKVMRHRLGHKRLRFFKDKEFQLSHSSSGFWYQMEIKKLVRSWIKDETSNLGLKAELYDGQGNSVLLLKPGNSTEEKYTPFLQIAVAETRNWRPKRAMRDGDCDEGDAETRCCRYPLTAELPDFVIAPRTYSVWYCAGECPYQFLQKYPYTHLAAEQNDRAGPCCSPSKRSSISMLYYDNSNNIIYQKVDDMVVERCACA